MENEKEILAILVIILFSTSLVSFILYSAHQEIQNVEKAEQIASAKGKNLFTKLDLSPGYIRYTEEKKDGNYVVRMNFEGDHNINVNIVAHINIQKNKLTLPAKSRAVLLTLQSDNVIDLIEKEGKGQYIQVGERYVEKSEKDVFRLEISLGTDPSKVIFVEVNLDTGHIRKLSVEKSNQMDKIELL